MADHLNYIGIDPGFTGAVARFAVGPPLRLYVADIPVIGGRGRKRQYDLEALVPIFKRLQRLPATDIALEYPSTRPGEGAERSKRFGEGIGILRGIMAALGIEPALVVPNLWKGRLGLPGKTDPEANKQAAALFDTYYPEFTDLIRGPRGGLKSGRIDAALIAHWRWVGSGYGMRAVIAKFGKDSPEAQMIALMGGRKRKRHRYKGGPI